MDIWWEIVQAVLKLNVNKRQMSLVAGFMYPSVV